MLTLRLLSLLPLLLPLFAPGADAQTLSQPYYISPRSGGQHIDLSSDWLLAWRDRQVSGIEELDAQSKWLTVKYPTSVQMALYHAGELPHPYEHLNSEKYRWVDEKVWYYRKSFRLPETAQGQFVFLAFDGIDYFARVWLNGHLLGEHEGMFGGPVIEIGKSARYGADNQLAVEVRAGNWGNKAGYKPRDSGRIIKPWVIAGGVGGEMFFPLGMWRGARIEVLPRTHIERPSLTTRSVNAQEARLHLSLELLSGTHSLEQQLHPWNNVQMRYYRDWWRVKPLPSSLTVDCELVDPQTNKAELSRRLTPKGLEGRNWVEEDLIVPKPRLWWANGLGDPHLYRVRLTLKDKEQLLDSIEFDYGIRTLTTEPTAGPRMTDRWADWQFALNGRKFFVKGMNWMPADILLDLPPERYEWLLTAVRDCGIQLVRVWGGGLIEPDSFYRIADRLGILVWQDFPIGNAVTPKFPQAIWEAQVMQTIFRLRNHASLALYCGGNEFNPYAEGNAASIGILERSVHDFDPSRPFRRTSPDAGSMHDYPDMDPAWYSRKFPFLPYMSETGMHNVPNASTMRAVISHEELAKPLSNIYSPDFEKRFPEFRHHFVEFEAVRVPRMMSRGSHIADMSAPTIDSLAEATQIGAGEFYQVFSELLQANYPVTAGVMPWVFKRPWPVVAIQLVDGFGQPTAPYYFLKRSYQATHVLWRVPNLLWAPGETVTFDAAVTRADTAPARDVRISIEVLDDRMQRLHRQDSTTNLGAGPSVTESRLGRWQIPKTYANRFFFVVVEARQSSGTLISRSTYWPRSLEMLSDSKTLAAFRDGPKEWPTLEHGPWLKPSVAQTATTLTLMAAKGNTLQVKNTGKTPAFPVQVEIKGVRAFTATDNFFWLAPGESRMLSYKLLPDGEAATPLQASVSAWNASAANVHLP